MENIHTKQNQRQVKRIDILPDDVLLEIFDFYMNMQPLYGDKLHTEAWQSLIHVCRQWRSLVLVSPRRLNLQLCCTPKTSAKGTQDVWPLLPLIIEGSTAITPGTENIIAMLGLSSRIRLVTLHFVARRQLEEVLAAMQVPFPELKRMQLSLSDESLWPAPVISDSFLGGSAPRLQYFEFLGIPFPGLPKLLLCATHLVTLWLDDIPSTGSFSPEAIVALLSVLSSLRRLSLEFRWESLSGWESQNPRKRSVLPALNEFRFKGDVDYLEELVAHIDTPQLDAMHITIFCPIELDCRRLARYIHRTPTFGAYDEAHVQFFDSAVCVALRHRTSDTGTDGPLIEILSREPHWQHSSIEEVCGYLWRPLSTVEDLYIEHRYLELDWVLLDDDSIEDEAANWSLLFHPFTSLKNLYLSKEFAPGIAASLQNLEGIITEELPSLQNIFVDAIGPSWGLFNDNVGGFIAARQLSGRPVTISFWDKTSESM